MDNPFQLLNKISVCSGILGLDRGVERVAGPIRTLAYVEIESFIIANLLEGMQAGKLAPTPIWANLKTFDWRPFRGKLGLLVGGYPCQPFSTAGLRRGEDDPRHLWPFLERGIRTARPVCCFFENVSGHVSLGLEQVIDSLRAMGYAVEAGLYSAEEVGAPHKRLRIFILAVLDDARRSPWGQDCARWIKSGGPYNLQRGGEENTDRFELESNERKLDDAPGGNGGLYQGFGGPGKGASQPSGPSEELANADRDGAGADTGSPRRQSGEDESQTQWQERDEAQRQRCGADIGDGGASGGVGQADSGIQGLEERREQPAREKCPPVERGGNQVAYADRSGFPAIGTDGEQAEPENKGIVHPGAYRWPAGPGQQQYDWEAPRTIESRVGCTVDGYNFREDLLRALGNGVVEQQAELAFWELLNKIFL